MSEHIQNKHDIHHVFTAEAAIEALKNEPRFDIVSLDHDLGKDKTEGRVVSRFIKEVSKVWPDERIPPPVIVHSWNIPAATAMVGDLLEGELRDVVQAPFRTFNYARPGIPEKEKA